MDQRVQRDQSSGLILFGILQILIGLACGAILLGTAAGLRRGGAVGTASTLFSWAFAAAFFVSAGIGSIRKRRWARALSVVGSALWLAGGLVATTAMVALVPETNALGTIAVLVILPLILFLFYRRLDVGLTCDRLDPKRRWTDRAPLPVLALALGMGFTALWLLVNLSTPALPLFGSTLTGAPAALAVLALAALSAVLAVQLYRLKESAWWTMVLLQIAGCTLTVAAVMRASGPVNLDPLVIALMVLTWIGYFAFLLYVRRYFGGRSMAAVAATS